MRKDPARARLGSLQPQGTSSFVTFKEYFFAVWAIDVSPNGKTQYVDVNGVNYGFLRLKNGAVTTFDVPNAGTGSGQGIPVSNNLANAISGFYIDASGVAHGFLRTHPE